jgi:plastocyanin
MRRPPVALARTAITLAAIAFAATACVGVPGPGWTFAPPTVPPPSQPAASGAASVAPSAPASAAPSTAMSGAPASGAPAPSAASSGATGGAVVQVSALNVNFEQAQVGAPAGVAFVIHFNNKDTGVLHDIAIVDASGTQVFLGTAITGPAEVDYQVPALPAGTYQFVCTIHPGMSGMLMVGG